MGWLFFGDYFRCCSYFRPIHASNGTRFLYCLFLLICTSLSACLLSREVSEKILSYIDFASKCSNFSEIIYTSSSFELNCSDLLAVSGAYRIFLSLSIFHCVLFFATLGVNSNRTRRARIHNGFWAWKVLFLVGLIFGSFLIKTTPNIEIVLMIIGMVGASAFLVVQLFCLSDFAANWAVSWEAAAAEKGNHWNVFIWILSLLFSAMFCAISYLMYNVFLFYPDGSPCTENVIVLVSNGLLSLILLLTSFLCLSQRSSSSILQCSILSVYISFLTASALASFPAQEHVTNAQPANTTTAKLTRCRDFSFLESFVSDDNLMLPDSVQHPRYNQSGTADYLVYNVDNTPIVSLDTLLRAMSLMFAILSGCYTSFRNVSGFRDMADVPMTPLFCCSGSSTPNTYDTTVSYIDDEEERLQYNYNLLHLMYISASLYMMMTLTNWYQPEKVNLKSYDRTDNSSSSNGANSKELFGGVEEIANGSIAIFWVKSATAFACQFLFLIIVVGRFYHRNRTTQPTCKWFINGKDLVSRQRVATSQVNKSTSDPSQVTPE